MTTTVDRLTARSLHEAGHAVAGLVLGLGVTKVDVIETADRGGLTTWARRGSAWNELVGTYCGPQAEAKATGEERWLDTSPADDVNQVDALLTKMAGLSLERRRVTRFQARRAADDLLCEHWAAIVRVADALVSRRSLTGAEFERLVSGRSLAPAARAPAASTPRRPAVVSRPAAVAARRGVAPKRRPAAAVAAYGPVGTIRPRLVGGTAGGLRCYSYFDENGREVEPTNLLLDD